MKKNILILIGLFMMMQIHAQSIELQVIGAGGMTLSNGNVTMDFTVGEMVITTVTKENVMLTQGFHQNPFGEIIVIDPEPEISFSIYPNPTSGWLYIQGKNIERAEVYSITGQKVFSSNQSSFDISHLSAGVYVVYIQTNERLITKRIVRK